MHIWLRGVVSFACPFSVVVSLDKMDAQLLLSNRAMPPMFYRILAFCWESKYLSCCCPVACKMSANRNSAGQDTQLLQMGKDWKLNPSESNMASLKRQLKVLPWSSQPPDLNTSGGLETDLGRSGMEKRKMNWDSWRLQKVLGSCEAEAQTSPL